MPVLHPPADARVAYAWQRTFDKKLQSRRGLEHRSAITRPVNYAVS